MGLIEHEETRLLNNRVVCLQPRTGYRTAIDPVFLAAAVPAKPGNRIMDVGSGTGAATLCLAARIEGLEITGIEIQMEYAALANNSAQLNQWSDRLRFENEDLASLPPAKDFREFDHVMTNPPFVEAGRGRTSPDRSRALAHMESGLALGDWLVHCLRLVRSGGTLTVIHRGDRLVDILDVMSTGLGGIKVFPLWTEAREGPLGSDSRAGRVIVQGKKGSRAPFRLLRGMRVHENNTGSYSAEAARILAGKEGLDMGD